MDQQVIDKTVEIATRAALSGNPVERVVWIPPQTASESADGVFAVSYQKPMSERAGSESR